jgi:competence protein ComEC
MQPAIPRPILAWLADAVHRTATAERGRFAPFLAVAVASGAALYYTLAGEPDPRTGASMIATGLALLLIGRGRWFVGMLALLTLAAGLGFAAAQWSTARAPPRPDLPTRAAVVVGTVERVEALPEGRRVMVARPSINDAAPIARSLRIRLRATDPAPVAAGDVLRVRAMLMPPAGAPLPGGWDIQFDAFHDGLAGYGYALNPAEILASPAPSGPAARIQALRETVVARIHAALPGPAGRVAAGLVVGERAGIPPEIQAAFRDSGLSHLLSISGLHMSIAMGLAFAAVRMALAAVEWTALHWPTKAIAALAALAAGAFYTLLAGAQVPMLRSFAAACLVTLAILAGRRALSMRAWALALAAIVLAAPHEVMGVSLQMSFAATLALIAGFEALRPWLRGVAGQGSAPRKAGAWLVALALTSALAGTASAPLGAYHFGAVQIYYVVSNLAAVPLTGLVVMPAAMVGLLLMPLGLEQPALAVMGWGVEGLLAIGQAVAAWPQAVVPVPRIAGWGIAAYCAGFAWLALWRSPLRLLGLPVIVAGLASAPLQRPPDVLVSADARLIALRAGTVLHVLQTQSPSSFVLDSWLRHLGLRDWQALPEAGGGSADGQVSCDDSACTLRPHPGGAVALLLRRGEPGATACDHALVVSPEPLRLDCDVAVIDRFSVWREGAHAVWLEQGGPRIATDRDHRGDRPWVMPLPTRTRQQPGPLLPPALVDTPRHSGEADAEQ